MRGKQTIESGLVYRPDFRNWTGILVFALSICVHNHILAQFPDSISVLSSSTLQPIENVAVFNTRLTVSAFTSPSGKVSLRQFNRQDTLVFRHPSYYEERLTFKDLARADFTVYLIDKIIFLEEFVIAVSKTEERIENISNKVDILYPQEITRSSLSTTPALLEKTGNVYVHLNQQGGGSPVLRGMPGNKVLLVLDGIRLNNAITNSSQDVQSLFIDPNIIDRTEIVYGPGSVIYGSDALGGALHFYTRMPKLSMKKKPLITANLLERYATVNHEKTGHFDLNAGNRKFASLSSFTFSDFDDLRAGNLRNPFYPDFGKKRYYVNTVNDTDIIVPNEDVNRQIPSSYQRLSALQKLLFRPDDHLDIILNCQYHRLSPMGNYERLQEQGNILIKYPRQLQYPLDTISVTDTGVIVRGPRYARWDYGPRQLFFHAIQTKFRQPTRIYDNASYTAAYQRLTQSTIRRQFNQPWEIHQQEAVDVFQLNLDFYKKSRITNSLVYGIEAVINRVTSDAFKKDIIHGETLPAPTRYPDRGSNMQSYAGYIKYKLAVADKAIFTPGFRFNQLLLHARFGDQTYYALEFDEIRMAHAAFSGSFSIVVNPNDHWHLNMIASSGFRNPNIDDIGKIDELAPGILVIPNPQLKPEFVYNIEFGVVKKFGDNIRMGAYLFNMLLKEAILLQPFTLDEVDSAYYEGNLSRVMAYVNGGNAVIRGVNLSFEADITTSLSFESTLNYTYGRDKTNDRPLPHIPPVYGNATVNYRYKQLGAGLEVRFNGWKRLSDYGIYGEDNLEDATPEGTPAWYIINISAAYQFNRYFGVQASLNNLLDLHYRPFSSGISAPGRNFSITLHQNF